MRLKPKMTTLNPKALLYKRFTQIEISENLSAVYKTVDNKKWTFDTETLRFKETNVNVAAYKLVATNECLVCIYLGDTTYYKYSTNDGWEKSLTQPQNTVLLSATFNNIGKYQTNKYYYVGAFDYVKKGAIEGSTTQYVKGNIMPLDTMSIQHYNDHIHIEINDLVVIKKRLYMVQNPVEDHKHMPYDYTIYSCDLISIL